MTLEVQIHSGPPAGPTSWVFCWPKWVFIGKKIFPSKVLILYTVGKPIENWTQNNETVGSGNGLVMSYSHTEILTNRAKREKIQF